METMDKTAQDSVKVVTPGKGVEAQSGIPAITAEKEPVATVNPAFLSPFVRSTAQARTRGRKDETAMGSTIVFEDFKTVIEKGFKKALGPSGAKMSIIIDQWFYENHDDPHYRILIPIDVLAEKFGYYVNPKLCLTAEELEKQEAITKRERKNFKDKLLKIMIDVFKADYRMTGTDPQFYHYIDSFKFIKGKYIEIFVGATYGHLLLSQGYVTYYPDVIYSLDETREDAFSIALELCHNYMMYKNYLTNRENYLKVSTILRQTSYEDFEAIRTIKQPQKKRNNVDIETGEIKSIGERSSHRPTWKEHRSKLENDLNYLKEAGLIDVWYYVHDDRKRTRLTKEEIENLKSFDDVGIVYELKGYPPRSERMAAANEWAKEVTKAVKNRKDSNRRRSKKSAEAK